MRRIDLCFLAAIVMAACTAERPRAIESERVPPELASVQASAADDGLALARMLTGLQRDLFARLADFQKDPAPLLVREFQLIDRSDSLAWQQFSTSHPFSRRDDYLGILTSRLPSGELTSESFELWKQEDGSVAVVSHLPEGRMNMTVWMSADGSWKARAIVLNPSAAELEWLAANTRPLLAQ